MPEKYNWTDVAGTAKKWFRNKVTQTVTADRRTRQQTEANEWQLEREMKEQVGGAALITAFPGLGRAMDRQEENRRRADQESTDRKRAQREAAVVRGSSIELAGHVSGRIDDVAVQLTPDEEYRTLTVLLEPVDPAPVQGGVVVAAGFALTDFHGDGEYRLVEYIESLDPGVHHVALDTETEDATFYWVEEYGPGVATVANGAIEATLVCQNASSNQIRVRMRVPLA